ncbi:P-loop containing nucleoside triphosphate hydrolase protein [Exidia glandulosa HHB12029]|uniref:p-loop containing nucleoside triphosphate hydrolase protein n=1 Tax=Exidia glandulosa HHB12029 TaxID=1314781 RepID=A0A165JLI1_EXIGL|nr:P-loop containing nucleoside triphosphate hydrolase protein [Exidia glandulosa HHB12029]
MSRRPCNFYGTPAGCRRGASCTFLHTGPPGGSGSSRSPGAVTPRISPSTSNQNNSNLPPVPNGVCQYYWKRGSCTRGSACRYRHLAAPGVAVRTLADPAATSASGSRGNTPSSSRPSSPAIPTRTNTQNPTGTCRKFWLDGTCPFEFDCKYRHQSPSDPSPQRSSNPFTSLSAVRNSDRDRDTLGALTANQVQTYLVHGRYLQEDYTFRSSAQMQAFLDLLSNAVPSNKSWNTEDGHLLLNKLAADDHIGLTRLRDIFTFGEKEGNEVSPSAGTLQNKLSFQRGYMKLFAYYSSDFVLKSTLDHRVNALYGVIHHNFSVIVKTVRACMETMMRRGTFGDPMQQRGDYAGATLFSNLITTILEYVIRYKQAVSERPEAAAFVQSLATWTRVWTQRVSCKPPTFTDSILQMPAEVSASILRDLERRTEQVLQIVDRETQKSRKLAVAPVPRAANSEGVLAALQSLYVGPGEDRPDGPRHDNDFKDIANIRVAPTHQELVCRIPPFLPANIPQAPHPHPAESMERLLDIQFRLLREELTAPLRTAVQTVLDDLEKPAREQTQLSKILKNNGGRYRTDSVMFSVYTNVAFVDLKAERRGIATALQFDAPPGSARASSANARENFWKTSGGKRLMPGGLVALLWKTATGTTIHLGLISSSLDDIAKSGRSANGRVVTRVVFFDTTTDMRVLEELHSGYGAGDIKLMLEAPVMYESVRPFLEALRAEPARVPFAQYLVHRVDGSIPPVAPPAYATKPGFVFNLSSLLNPPEDGGVPERLRLNAADAASVQVVRTRLREDSYLDPSQSDALVDSLVREIAMIQGPPGTGKSFIGVQLLRVLLQSGVRPILLIAFTNHALDHLLEAVLDAKITTNVVRLGSKERATERLKQFSMDTLELVQAESRLDRTKRDEWKKLKEIQKEVENAARKISQHEVAEDELLRHLSFAWPDHNIPLRHPPSWVEVLLSAALDEVDEGWQEVGKEASPLPTVFSFWQDGRDIQFLRDALNRERSNSEINAEQHPANSNRFAALGDADVSGDDSSDGDALDAYVLLEEDEEDDFEAAWLHRAPHAGQSSPSSDTESQRDVEQGGPTLSPDSGANNLASTRGHYLEEFFERFGLPVPEIPTTDRTLEELQSISDVWSFSLVERQRLALFWHHEARESFHLDNVLQFERLRADLTQTQRRYDAVCDQARLRLLYGKDIIGCTTNGAAKLTALMKALAPKAIMVEEAGQVLEAHVLGSLVPSVEHLLCIGDPFQLRPTINNYSLSIDSQRGAELYRFDMSTMERLSQNGLPMSRLNVQRRMRPAIADLIRVPFLYPDLQDHPRVQGYPNVAGMPQNIFFMTHENKEEGGGDDSVSKHNTFEVKMIVDLVTYLIRQSPRYAEAGSIVVLCAYLGQLVRLRDAFARLFTVVIDERDQTLLDDRASDEQDIDNPQVERVAMSQRILLRTVDNFQGEEADIICLSLVRNSGELADGGRTTIGFLKSINRTNVALSRARHGLYIFGNAGNLASHSRLWASVVGKLQANDSIGTSIPFICPRHQDVGVRYASKPGDIPFMAPDGGCLYQCIERLSCGHACPHKCHPDSHAAVVCVKPCQRLCIRGHPCDRQCADKCGDCRFPMSQVQLPCGHVADRVPCFRMDNLDAILCTVQVQKKLPNCDHSAVMSCSEDASQWKCQESCGMNNPLCGHVCKGRCHECQVPGNASERKHVRHACGRHLFCQHPCAAPCGESGDHHCTTDCRFKCRQVCSHFSCKKPCGAPCEPCKEPCRWSCPHYSCPVPCGSPCARLPCDSPCLKQLGCGHPCPSVCGEPCEQQICPQCAPDETSDVVDYILQRTLHEVDPTLGTLDELLITLDCRHVFTVETLDGTFHLAEYYQQADDGRWIALAIPEAGYKPPLGCPKCRAPITSPRYGRAYKRADLDVLEQNAAGHMSRRITSLNKSVTTLDTAKLQAKVGESMAKVERSGCKDISLTDKAKRAVSVKHVELVKRFTHSLVTGDEFSTRNVLPVSKAELDSWKHLSAPLWGLYNTACTVADSRFAHVTAYEAAFSTLYRAEFNASIQNPDAAPRDPEQHALIQARISVGQTRPRADTRFVIEAIWRSIEIRLSIATLACEWMKTVSGSHPRREEAWAVFCRFIYKSCERSADWAVSCATKADAHRQVLRSHLLVMRVRLEMFSFNVIMWNRRGAGIEDRDKLLELLSERTDDAANYRREAVNSYRQQCPRSPEDEEWINENFVKLAAVVQQGWSAAERSLRSGVFYQPVTLADKMAVIEAFDFSHTGHFYCCPNGHTYVITECGGAMQSARCPVCGAQIGGGNHNLDASNRRDDGMEQLVRQRGAQQNPFLWGA